MAASNSSSSSRVSTTQRRHLLRGLSLTAGLLGLALLLVSVTEYGESGKLGVVGKENLQTLRQYDSYLTQPSGTTYRPDGAIAYRWEAERANRLPDGEILLVSPTYRGLKANRESWTATAEHGTLAADGQQLDLKRDVVILDFIHQARIASPALTLDMADNLIYTQAPVKFDSPNAVTTATGMRAAMDSEQLQFLANVRGRYEP